MDCPKCHYRRQPSDNAPAWQCPACGIAYAKASGANLRRSIPLHERARYHNPHAASSWLDHSLTVIIIAGSVLLALSFWYQDRLPPLHQLRAELQHEPVQQNHKRAPFIFDYRGERYRVEPIADYELWGLVVSHNDITGLTDIMHTKDSVDIKDLCVIWGQNVQHSDYQNVRYRSGDFICYFEYPYGTSFNHYHLSNNHVLSDNETIRERIRQTRIGDQIRLRGMLVNYYWESKPGWFRQTSTTRQDTGNGACEVVFVSEYEILDSANRIWHVLFNVAIGMIIVGLILKVTLWALPRR